PPTHGLEAQPSLKDAAFYNVDSAVGMNGANRPDDVMLVQCFLRLWSGDFWSYRGPVPKNGGWEDRHSQRPPRRVFKKPRGRLFERLSARNGWPLRRNSDLDPDVSDGQPGHCEARWACRSGDAKPLASTQPCFSTEHGVLRRFPVAFRPIDTSG